MGPSFGHGKANGAGGRRALYICTMQRIRLPEGFGSMLEGISKLQFRILACNTGYRIDRVPCLLFLHLFPSALPAHCPVRAVPDI